MFEVPSNDEDERTRGFKNERELTSRTVWLGSSLRAPSLLATCWELEDSTPATRPTFQEVISIQFLTAHGSPKV
jgi:hypothetical protein